MSDKRITSEHFITICETVARDQGISISREKLTEILNTPQKKECWKYHMFQALCGMVREAYGVSKNSVRSWYTHVPKKRRNVPTQMQ